MSKEIDDGGPAFPCPHTGKVSSESSLTKRDWFAGLAMQGMLAANLVNLPAMTESNIDEIIALEAYRSADAMIFKRTQHLKSNADKT